MKKVKIRIVTNPFNQNKNIRISFINVGETIYNWVKNNKYILNFPVVCLYNGQALLREKWDKVLVSLEDTLTFLNLPLGDSSSGKSSGAKGLSQSDITSMINNSINTSDPLKEYTGILGKPKQPSTDAASQLSESSPNYSVELKGNRARIGSAIPVIYGKYKIYPDFATKSYNMSKYSQKKIYQIYVIGNGYYDISDVKMYENSYSKDILSWEKIDPGKDITIFEPNTFFILLLGKKEQISYDNYTKPIIITPKNRKSSSIELDILFEDGFYIDDVANKKQETNEVKLIVEYRIIDENDKNITNWQELIVLHMEASTKSDQRITQVIKPISPNRYEIRLKKQLKTFDSKKSYKEKMFIEAVRSNTNLHKYSVYNKDLTLLAVKILKPEKIIIKKNNNKKKLSCIAYKKIKTWSPDKGWSKRKVSSSICWSLADMLKSKYGGNLSDSKIDLLSLYETDKILNARGDYFNGVYDRKMSLWEAIRLICRAGRSTGILQNGIFRIIRDRKQNVPVLMFSTRNIVKNSFSISYNLFTKDSNDGVNVEFVNKDTWEPENIAMTHDGKIPKNPMEVKLFGCTDKKQAIREALYLSRNAIYRRKVISLQTELEGYIPTFGDMVIISHDVPRWGISAEVIGFDKSKNYIIISEKVKFKKDTKHYIIFRLRNGSASAPWQVFDTGFSNYLSLGKNIKYFYKNSVTTIVTNEKNQSVRLYYGTSEEKTHISFGHSEKWVQKGVIKSIKPSGKYKISFKILSEDDRVHKD